MYSYLFFEDTICHLLYNFLTYQDSILCLSMPFLSKDAYNTLPMAIHFRGKKKEERKKVENYPQRLHAFCCQGNCLYITMLFHFASKTGISYLVQGL